MKVYTKCPHCKKETAFITFSETRFELFQDIGLTKSIKCRNCHELNKIHVNSIYAKKSKFVYVLAGIIFIVLPIVIFIFILPVFKNTGNPYSIYSIGSLIIVPSIIYTILIRQDVKRVRHFNLWEI